MQKKLHIKKGDTVVVTAGKDRGKEGNVLKVDRTTERVLVEGVNIVKKHEKPSAANTEGGIVEKEAGIHVSNLKLVHNGTATRVGRKTDDKSGKLVRYSKKSGEIIE